MAEENADSPRQASPASYPGVVEVIESVQLLRKELGDGLKDIHDKLDAQDKRILAVEAFVKNAQNSVPDMDDEWRDNDVGYDFSFDRAGKYQGDNAEASNINVVMEGEVALTEPEGDGMEKSENVMDPSVIAAESQIESEGETDEVGYEEIERTPSVVVKRENQKLKILSSKKKRIRRTT
ncbi:unnamed protein product [Arabis nemorensis]|uniref:Uncharacterized protein n=1 Tax=Arabis nemorensis TaxID=586526 RepID=A0A565CD51_9BRAS|nr:unnamed protein product [Arabis nemorensis]